MGSYTFTWRHPANEVYVTGTFDNWSKSEKLEKVGGEFTKTVHISDTSAKILYKFVVDGNWTTDHTADSERDSSGNINNVLKPHHFISSAAPESTTTALAGQIPLEKSKGFTSIPGGFPETPAVELSNPTGAPDQTLRVAPIPATAGAGNPVSLAPGEKVPDSSTYTPNTVDSNVRLDKESYENSDAAVPQLPPVLNKQEEAEAAGIAGMFGLPAIGGTMIPESSLPMGGSAKTPGDVDPTISSAAPGSTTAQLAGQQPIQPRRVPEIVRDSTREAHGGPSASVAPDVVQHKDQVQDELKEKVPETPTTSESGLLGKSENGTGIAAMAAGGIATAGAAIAGAAYYARDKTAEATGKDPNTLLPEFVQNTIDSMNAKSDQAATSSTAPVTKDTTCVPEVVADSEKQAHVSPEDKVSPELVKGKAAVQNELTHQIKPTQESGEPAPSASASLSAAAPVKPTTGLTPAPDTTKTELNAPATVPAQTPATKKAETAAAAASSIKPPIEDSRDVSPTSKPTTVAESSSAAPAPTVPTGDAVTSTTTTPKKTGPGSILFKDTPDSSHTAATDASDATASPSADDKKNKRKRRSLFGKLKDKLKG